MTTSNKDKDQKVEKDELPKQESSDYTYALVKGGLGAIPIVGGVISEFFSLTVTSPLQNRLNQWLSDLYKEIQILKEKNKQYDEENLQKNERFASIVNSAVRIVLSTNDPAKLKILKNAALNSVVTTDVNFQQQIFTRLIDNFTANHIIMINLFIKEKEPFYELESIRHAFLSDQKDSPDRHILSKLSRGTVGSLLGDLESTNIIERFYPNHFNDKVPPNPNKFKLRISDFGKSFFSIYHKMTLRKIYNA